MSNARKLNFFSIAVFAIISAMALPLPAAAKDRHKGRGRGRDFDRFSRKCEKFVNCHDARDGRWDGRGPNRRRVDNRLKWNRRFRNRDLDDDDARRLQRRRIRNYRYDDSFRDYGYDFSNPYRSQNFNWTDLLNMFQP